MSHELGTSGDLTPRGGPGKFPGWIIAVVVLLVPIFSGTLAWIAVTQTPHTGPSDFAGDSAGPGAPGSPGCRNVTGEFCLRAEISSSFPNLPASNLFFAVSNETWASYPEPNNYSLGPNATVSLLNSTGVVGVWNLSRSVWMSSPPGSLPISTPIQVVLDTGLRTDPGYHGAYFYVEHSQPYGGAVGFALT